MLLYNVTLADSQENFRWLSNPLQLSGKPHGQDINLPAPSLVPSLLLSWSPARPPMPHQRGSESSGTSGASNSPKIVDAGRAEDRSYSRADRKGIKLNLSVKSNAVLSQLMIRIMQVLPSKLQMGFKINCTQQNMFKYCFQICLFIANTHYFCHNYSLQEASTVLFKDGDIS